MGRGEDGKMGCMSGDDGRVVSGEGVLREEIVGGDGVVVARVAKGCGRWGGEEGGFAVLGSGLGDVGRGNGGWER